jgi:hypothetical protein
MEKKESKSRPMSGNVQNPAIPFPQSQKHYSNKLSTNMLYESQSRGGKLKFIHSL